MSEIFHFVSKSQRNAKFNLNQFIHKCEKDLTVFGKDLNWSSWKWPGAGNFTKIGAHSRTTNTADKMDENFINFAKAYFRYQQGHHPTGTKNELKALRAIEAALIQFTGSASIDGLSIAILDEASQLIRKHYSKSASYHGGKELERLAKFLTNKRLISLDLSNWRNPIQRAKDEIQTGSIAKARREKKLPSEVALYAMAEIFANKPLNLRDVFTTSVFAMLMSAPSRISEVLELPVDCEIEEIDSNGLQRYGLRFYSGKGYGPNIKWIPTEMVSVAKEAVTRIKNMTEESRKLAEWIESNPAHFYRHAQCPKVDEYDTLSMKQVCLALGLVNDTKKQCSSSLRGCGLVPKDGYHTLNGLWKYVLSRQPEGFPWLSKEKKIKYSNALFCMQRNLIGSQRGSSPVILWAPTNNIINNDLSPREVLTKGNHKSIFDRNAYLTPDKQRVKLTSHQARHFLNTLAQRGGLSQLEIAKWSGRADPGQNRTYNHINEYEMIARAEQLDTSLSLFGPPGKVQMNVPITIQEFNTLEKGPVHLTEFGVCVHDFTMSPCDKYRDCLNCNEQVCIKGEEDKLERVKKRYEEVKKQFSAAEESMKDGSAGADRWYEYHKSTLEHLNQLIAILENPDIENGAQIKLKNDKAFSPLRRAIESKILLEKDTTNEHFFQNMTAMLGGGLG